MKTLIKLILLFLIISTTVKAQTTINVDVQDVFAVNIKTGYIYNIKTVVQENGDSLVSIYQPVIGNGLTRFPQGSTENEKKEIMVMQYNVSTYKKSYFDSILPTLDQTDSKVIQYKQEQGNFNNLILDRLSFINRIKVASGVSIQDTNSIKVIDSLQRLLLVDFLRLKDSIKLVDRKSDTVKLSNTALKLTNDSLKSRLISLENDAKLDTAVIRTKVSMTVNLAIHKTIIVDNGLVNGIVITLPSPVGHKKMVIIKRNSADVTQATPNSSGTVSISCPGFIINGHTSIVGSSLTLSARGIWGSSVILISDGTRWQTIN